MDKLQQKLAKLPMQPGVYFFKNAAGEIIYVGKAARLRNRVRSYFQKGRPMDAKTSLLVQSIADLDWQIVASEADALFLEAEMVRRYKPQYNILLRDDKSYQYVRIDYGSDYPTVTLVRRPLPDSARYFGPFGDSLAIKRTLKLLRRAFPYATSRPNGRRVKLHYYLGLDPGLEEGRTKLADYRANLRKLMQYLRGNRVALGKQLEREMKTAAKSKQFEQAAKLRDQISALKSLDRSSILASEELAEANRDHALNQLADLLGLKTLPRRIEGFDISHIQGSDNTASMVVFMLGLPEKTEYRKFKMRIPGNDDFAHMAEAISRRLSERNVKKWGLPDLILIDGGKGQLSAAIEQRDAAGYSQVPMVGIAKQEETIVVSRQSSLAIGQAEKAAEHGRKLGAYIEESGDYIMILLPESAPAIKLIQRIRDESHRFARNYHSQLRAKRATASLLESMPGIGPVTRRRLVRQYGSLRAAGEAPEAEIVQLFGPVQGKKVFQALQNLKT